MRGGRVVFFGILIAAGACGTLTDPGPSVVIAPGDASSDATGGEPRDGGSVVASGCAAYPNATVCADFEDGMLPTGGFDKVNGTAGSTLVVEPEDGGHVLRVATGALAGATTKSVVLTKTLDTVPKALTFGAKIRRGPTDVNLYTEWFAVETITKNDLQVVVASGPTNTLRILDSSGGKNASTDHSFTNLPPAFTRIDVKLFFEPTGVSIQVWRDGMSVQDKVPLKSDAGTTSIAGPLLFAAGMHFQSTGTTAGFDVYLDDVTLVVEP